MRKPSGGATEGIGMSVSSVSTLRRNLVAWASAFPCMLVPILTMREEPMAISSRSVVTVPRTASVMEAIEIMAASRIGSVLIVDDGRLEGIFSERDVMLRVVLEHRDPRKTQVEEVMTTPVHAISMRTTGDEALTIMVQEHIRHLPIVDEKGRAQAIVSMRSLLQEKVSELHQQLDSLESYITADGIGG